ncbi:DUF6278 family protein [Streptomyces sp. INA 01156]
MNIPFLGHRREKPAVRDSEGIAELLAECELLRSQASRAGVRLDDSQASLEALDQLVPGSWRDDEDTLTWLGNDAGLYLGTVIVRTVPGAAWKIRYDGQPVVRLASGGSSTSWTPDTSGPPVGCPLSQLYAEVAEA